MKILAAIDKSKQTEEVVKYISEIAKKLKADLTFIHIVIVPALGAPEMALDVTIFLNEGETFLQKIQKDAEKFGVNSAIHLESALGNPAHKILEFAKKKKFNLIAIGAMGESKIKNLLLGSVADTIARNAPCPVLIIR